MLFFEYDHGLTRKAGKPDATAVWAELQNPGFSCVCIWDNFGKPIQLAPIDELSAWATALDKPLTARGYCYWDVAVVRADDGAGKTALDRLFTSGR